VQRNESSSALAQHEAKDELRRRLTKEFYRQNLVRNCSLWEEISAHYIGHDKLFRILSYSVFFLNALPALTASNFFIDPKTHEVYQ